MAATTVAYEPMKMTDLINITQEMSAVGAALRKNAGKDGFCDSTATSTECIESLQSSRRGLRFKLPVASGSSIWPSFDIGLISGAACPQHRDRVDDKSLTYAAHIDLYGNFYVLESGHLIGEFGTVKAGDTIDIRLTSEDLLEIEYCINGVVRYTSKKETSKQAPLFVKVCGRSRKPLVEDLQWIIEKKPATQTAELHASVNEQQTRIAALETQINEQQSQLQTCEGEKQSSQQRADEKEASLKVQVTHLLLEMEALQAVVERQKKEIQAGSDALLSFAKENAHLKVQLEAEKELSGASAENKAKAEEQAQHHQELQVEKAQLEANLEEKKAELEASSTIIDEQSAHLAELQAERDALQEANERRDRLQGQANETVAHQIQWEAPENLHLGPMKLGRFEEELLGVWIAKAKLEVRETQLRHAVNEENLKAELEKQLKAVKVESEQLQQRQARIEELHRHACQLFPAKATSQSSETDSSEWEALPSVTTTSA